MKDYCLFVPYVNRPDLLCRAVASVRELEPVIFDNSLELSAPYHEGLKKYNPTVPLTFSQTMNWFIDAAYTTDAKYCLMMHSDAEAEPTVGRQLLEICRYAQNGKWGCIFTAYDALVAFNVAACKAVGPWDTNLPWYLSDCDYYHRLRLAGYATLDSGLPVKHEPSQTLKASPKLDFLNRQTYPLYLAYYCAKWGGDNGQELFTEPWNGRCPKE